MQKKEGSEPSGSGSNKWMYPTVPANLSYGPLATLIPLYILQLGGGILEVSYAVTLSSAISIISIFIWGYVTDLFNKRKALILFTYLLATFLVLGFYFIKNIPEIILLYGALSFVTSASATPLNLLVMETSTQNKWTNKFSNLQMMASGGITIGLVIASLITGISTLENLILILSAFSFISFILALRLIKEPKRPIPKREPFTNGINSFISRLVTVPSLMIRIPHTGNIKNIFRFKGIKGTERNFLITFYLITFVFYLGTSIFSTAYPVSLRMYGLSQSYIFFVILMGMIVQTLVFHYYNYFAKGSSRRFIAYGSLLLRGASYLMIGTMFLPVFGVIFNLGNLLFYCLASGVAYAIYYTISYAIFFDTITGKTRGSTVGIYGSLAGVGTFGGALLSGALVVTHGYMITFAIAGLLMILCAFLFRVLPRLH